MTTEITLESLGITREDLIERIVQRISDEALRDDTYSDYIDAAMSRKVKAAIDAAVDAISGDGLEEKVKAMVDGVTLQLTNQWGESRGEAVTFREYITDRAEKYLEQDVDFQGRSYDECRRHGGSFSKDQKRVAHLIDKHLRYTIQSALQKALTSVDSAIANGIAETIKMQLEDVTKKLKVEVRTK